MTIGSQKINCEDRRGIVFNKIYYNLLKDLDLLTFDRLYGMAGGVQVKKIRERSVRRVEVQHGDTNTVLYLKRHEAARLGIWETVAGWLTGHSRSPGVMEFNNIRDFRRSGIPTVSPVAAGEQRAGFLRYKSFLITEDTSPYLSLETIIRQYPERLTGKEGRLRKKKIITAVARLARKMHNEGYNHRDYNATHVLIGPDNTDGEFDLALFDLQRTDRKKWMRFKWGIKVMAELSYSMPDPLFDNTDRQCLFLAYKGRQHMGMLEKFQWFWIKRKTRRIERHTEKIMKRKSNGITPPPVDRTRG